MAIVIISLLSRRVVLHVLVSHLVTG